MSVTSARNIQMSCSLTLTEREVKMLAWLAGYGGKQIAEAIQKMASSSWTKFIADRVSLEAINGRL